MEDWGAAAVWFAVGWCMGTVYKTWHCLKTKDMDSIVYERKTSNCVEQYTTKLEYESTP
jgi:hypothetical protein